MPYYPPASSSSGSAFGVPDVTEEWAGSGLSSYTYTEGSGMVEAAGSIHTNDGNVKSFFRDGLSLTDLDVITKFTSGTAPSAGDGTNVAAGVRKSGASAWIQMSVNAEATLMRMRCYLVTSGLTFTEKGSSTTVITVMSDNTSYWLRVTAIGNVLVGRLYDTDPRLDVAPILTQTVTLTGGDIAAAGAGVAGSVGTRVVANTDMTIQSQVVFDKSGKYL